MAMLIAAGLWGFAEATFFFLVPDLLLSALAISDWRLALWACLAALAGALAGGALMYRWGRRDPDAARRLLVRVPGIPAGMLDEVRRDVAARGLVALLLGPLSGTPYKLYAVESAALHRSFALFLLVSVPARMLRFLLVIAVVAWLSARALPALPVEWKYAIWAAAWLAFYLWYFRAMRRRDRR